MFASPRIVVTATLLAFASLVAACEQAVQNPLAPTRILMEDGTLAATAAGSGTKLVGDVVTGEYAFAPGDATVIASTCPVPAGTTWSLDFGHTRCLIVQPVWNPGSSFEPYALTDDVKLITQQENGREKRITHIRLLAQDVIGEAGIQHNTDWIPVAVPVAPDNKRGGTLHVHAANVAVWRSSGHTGGERVEMIGWISIGDLVYRSQ